MRTPDTDSAQIVMLGSFNPAIFQPRWLGKQQLIRAEEAEDAKIEIIRAEVADFSTEWFQLQVLQNRLTLASADPRHYAPLRDLAAALFTILPHTPITALGLNRMFHFKMPSSEAWHAIGHLLAPKDSWNPILESPGLRSMMMQGRRKHADGGTVRIKIEPSQKIEHGLYIEVNEDFRPSGDESDGAQWVPGRIGDHWDATMEFAEEAAEHLLGLVNS